MSMIVLTAIILASLFGACITAVVLGGRRAALRSRLAALEAELAASRNEVSAAGTQLDESASELRTNAEARSAAEKEVVRLSEQLKQQELQFAQQLQAAGATVRTKNSSC